ncbi:NAD(P)/FAD-dependent oxidoreductase [Lusitaniella coriacea LEGE 07157]|uniref:NAD(P)/FAD-dependent oxidoreductase n=1 Tax=Lusitaniella coriacea LEGE 07157 TaxID=945747 RepID=A0A8J7JAB2_9CYAN|nr:NAD(P)/FAD-dependent oxidoreductase [Lusitaniella coriacea]MBE9116160.1 NAD(P)/FAD-dependent oxidoreductase [Lusitaniella coriacea LEGE 07157]
MKIAIAGGGAAGFFSAITCAATYPHIQVLLLEAGRKPLSKVRISGGGRCNVTHHCFDPALLVQNYPRGGKVLRGAFSRFQPQDTVAWFEERGVRLKTEADGRMFPVTDDSETIINCLLESAQEAGVQIRTGVRVESVCKDSEGKFEIGLRGGEMLQQDRVLLATGSNPSAYQWAKDLGHTIIPPVPSLFTFKIKDPRLQDLAGVSVENARIRLLDGGKGKVEQQGALLVTHWGLSGPALLKLSAWGARILRDRAYKMLLQINWVPPHNPETLRQELLAIKSRTPKRQISTNCPLPIPKRLWQRLVEIAGIERQTPWAELSKKGLNALVGELTQGKYEIQGKGVFKEEFVTCGGIKLQEVDFKTMESRKCPGLYFAGEILDIDGVTGGFNFQSAWTTGWLAGQAMGRVTYL